MIQCFYLVTLCSYPVQVKGERNVNKTFIFKLQFGPKLYIHSEIDLNAVAFSSCKNAETKWQKMMM